MKQFNVHGWEHLSGDNPAVVAAREGILSKLNSVPEPHRTTWEKRLKSKLDHPHFSVRLEIYLYQFFRERSWNIEIEPEIASASNRPDFVVSTGNAQMIIEAKTVLGAKSERQQDDRLKQLMDDLSGKLNRTVLIHPMLNLPSSLPNRRISSEIESRGSESEVLQEFMVEGEHQGQPYSLEVTVMMKEKPFPTADVGAAMGQAVGGYIGHPVRKAIIEKADRYGEPNVPFVIAIWPKLGTHFSSADDDLVALYGDKEWIGPSYSQLREFVKPNGVFALKTGDGRYRYSHISVVIVCRPNITDNPLRIYHNLFAKCPVDMDAFRGVPQCTIDISTGQAQWSF